MASQEPLHGWCPLGPRLCFAQPQISLAITTPPFPTASGRRTPDPSSLFSVREASHSLGGHWERTQNLVRVARQINVGGGDSRQKDDEAVLYVEASGAGVQEEIVDMFKPHTASLRSIDESR